MSLAQAKNGATVSVVKVNAPDSYILQLAMLGIFPGAPLQVINNSLSNASVIHCRGARLVLGRGLPSCIEVKD